MASRSSRQRSAARAAAERGLLRSLLRDGARFLSPGPELIAHAEKLAELGLISLQHLRTVRCAASLDGDFPPPLPTCDGLIDLRPEADEGGGEYRCQICDRIIYPDAEQKQQFDSLVVHHQHAGIEAFLIDRCGDLVVGRTFSAGVLTLPVRGMNAAICLVDYCADERWLGRGFGVSQRCVYVTAGPDVGPRLLWEDAIAHVELVDVLIGVKDLAAIIIEHATTSPATLANIDPLVYSLGARPIAPGPQEQPGPPRVFHLCLSPKGLLVDGLLAVRVQRRATAMAILQVLMKTYAEAAAYGRAVEPMTADTLANAVEPAIGTVEDADSIARQIPRIRKSIVDTVRQHTGKPIGEHDVIETVSRSGANEDAEGYRLNPRSVALGPLQP